MEVQFGPNSHDELSLLYKLQHKVKVFSTANPLRNRGDNLVASVCKYGIEFIGSPDGKLAVYYLKRLVDKECDPQCILVSLQEKPMHISVNCDQEMLAVTGGQLVVVYKAQDFQKQATITLHCRPARCSAPGSPRGASAATGGRLGIQSISAS